MPPHGDEVYITGLETEILFVIGKHDPLNTHKEMIDILQTLITKLKGAVKNEDFTS